MNKKYQLKKILLNMESEIIDNNVLFKKFDKATLNSALFVFLFGWLPQFSGLNIIFDFSKNNLIVFFVYVVLAVIFGYFTIVSFYYFAKYKIFNRYIYLAFHILVIIGYVVGMHLINYSYIWWNPEDMVLECKNLPLVFLLDFILMLVFWLEYSCIAIGICNPISRIPKGDVK